MVVQSKHTKLIILSAKASILNSFNPITKKSLILFCLFLTISICTTNSFAQFTYKIDRKTRFERVGVEQGLSCGYTKCMHQDKYGFIWIGSTFGLNLYDGYQIKVFNNDPQNPRSIYNNYIKSIYEEPDGTMWFGTEIGISKYNRATQSFVNYIPDTSGAYKRCNRILKILPCGDKLWVSVMDGLFLFDKNTGLFQSFKRDTLNPYRGIYFNITNYIFIDQSDNLWVGSSSLDGQAALSKYDKKTGIFIHFLNNPDDPESFNGKEVRSMIEDKNGTIWVATFGGGLLEIIDKEQGKFKQYCYDKNDQYSLLNNNLYTVFEDSIGNIWTGGWYGFSSLNKNTCHFTNYKVPVCSHDLTRSNVINGITEDVNGELWLRSWDGFFKFNPSTNVLLHYIHDPENQSSLSGNFVIQIMHDHSGQAWILQFLSGISKLNNFANSFKKIEKNNYDNKPLSSNYVSRIFGDSKGNLWIGTRSAGLNKTRLNKAKEYNKFEHYVDIPDDSTSLSDNAIIAIYEDKNQILWIGTYGGLNKYDPINNNFVRYQHDPDDNTSIGSNDVETIFEDSYGTFWIGGRDGLNIMDRNSGKFLRFFGNKKDLNHHPDMIIRAIYEDVYGDVWFGGTYLHKLNRKDTSLIDFIPSTANEKGVYRIGIRRFGEDGLGNFWFATTKGGLYKINRNELNFTSLAVDNGISSNVINSFEIDDYGDIWVSTINGISRINQQDHSIRNFDMGDGMVSLEFFDRCSYKDKDGWLYFGGRNGFNVFHPDSIKDNKHIPPVYITALNIAHQPKYFEDAIYNIQSIDLQHNENDFSFDFVALDYINPRRNQFAYMLEGYDKDWIYVGNKRTAYYTNMSPGNYIFRVKASNNNGYWNEEGASIALVIHPPFWKTWWAYLIYTFLFGSLFYILYRNELKRLNLKRDLEIEHIQTEKLIEVDREKNNFFANVSHEFRTPLTLILGPLDKAISRLKDGKHKQELDMAYRNAKRLQSLINQLLSLSKLESGKMKLKAREENIVRLVKVYVQSFESLIKQKQMELIFESSLKYYQLTVDRMKVEKIMNNLLSNAIKFTEKGGKIKVSISLATAPSGPHRTDTQTSTERIRFSPSVLSSVEGIQIKVSDTGIGIKKEHLKQIFNRFYQVDSSHSQGYEGTGIGLALTKELVGLHQGTIKVESEVDSGTTFIVFLPAGNEHLNKDDFVISSSSDYEEGNELLADDNAYVDVPSTDKSPEVILEQAERKVPLILIVEDNNDMRAYIKDYLEQSYYIIEAVNGKDGFDKAIEHIPDLIVTDLMMATMDGNELTRKLKTDQRTSHIPVIILTAKVTMESKLEGLKTGADDFLTKPFDVQELLIRIRNLILQHQKLRNLFKQHIDNANQTRTLLEYSCIGMSKLDEQFLEKAVNVIEGEIANPDFGVEMFAKEMAMSRKHLHRKLTSLTDHSPNNLIRNVRLIKATELIKAGKLNITQISYDVGISSLSYFAKIFKERYGVSPSDYT